MHLMHLMYLRKNLLMVLLLLLILQLQLLPLMLLQLQLLLLLLSRRKEKVVMSLTDISILSIFGTYVLLPTVPIC